MSIKYDTFHYLILIINNYKINNLRVLFKYEMKTLSSVEPVF